MVNIAVFASGSGSNFENLVKAKMQYAKIKLLIVDKENAYAITRANQLKIPYIYVNPKAFENKEAYETQIVEYLNQYEIELIVLAGYMRYIGNVLLAHYPLKIINIHPAYLPNFPGAHGIKDAYDAQVKETGVTIHFVDAGVDTGTIIHQEKCKIEKDWTLEQLEERVHELEYQMYPKVLEKLCKENQSNEKSVN